MNDLLNNIKRFDNLYSTRQDVKMIKQGKTTFLLLIKNSYKLVNFTNTGWDTFDVQEKQVKNVCASLK